MIDPDKIRKHHVDVLMTKMFEMVNLDYKNEEIKREYSLPGWQEKNEWTLVQFKEFVGWVCDYLMSNTGARRALMVLPFKIRRQCLRAAYGIARSLTWKIQG